MRACGWCVGGCGWVGVGGCHCLLSVAATMISLVHTPSGWQGTPLSRVKPTKRPSSMYQWLIIHLMMRYSIKSLTCAKISSINFLSRHPSESLFSYHAHTPHMPTHTTHAHTHLCVYHVVGMRVPRTRDVTVYTLICKTPCVRRVKVNGHM